MLLDEEQFIHSCERRDGTGIQESQVQDLARADVYGKKYCYIKRALDIFLAFWGLMILLIPMVVIAAVIYIDDPGPVFFMQKRVGRYGKNFKLYKFRTMKVEAPMYMATANVDNPQKYITRVGAILRKLSLDEIPQLINVLKGEMSLVGPRPLIPNETDIHYMRYRFGVYTVRPGITGLAQINGRDDITLAEKLHWDVQYINHISLASDVRILFCTIPKVLCSAGVTEGRKSKNYEEE